MSGTKDSTSSVVDALDEWVRSITEPRVRPIQAKARSYAEEAVRAARSVDRRSEDLIARVKRGMFGLGDAKKNSSAMALIRICREASSAAQEFSKQDWASLPPSKLEAGLVRLGRTLAESYNTSGRLAAKYFRSEAFSLSGEIETLRGVNRQVSQFEARNRETMDANDSIREQVGLVRDQLSALVQLRLSQVQLEGELEQADSRMKVLQEKISQISQDSGIKSLDAVEAELRGLRRRLLQEEMSRMGGLLNKFSTIVQRGESGQPRGLSTVIDSYVETPLTSLARERDGYPKLRDALNGLLQLSDSGKLGVSEKKARKALERARKVVDGSLLQIQGEAREVFRARAGFLRHETVRVLRAQRLELRGEYSQLVAPRKELLSKKGRLEEQIADAQSQVVIRLGRIEKLADEQFGKKMPHSLRDRLIMAESG